MARRNNKTHEYLLRGLVSCGQCRLTCAGRNRGPGYHYYVCQGRTDALRKAQGERCTARYAPAQTLDELVWQDLCRVLSEPALLTHELERAQMGEWLPQALQARRQTLRAALAQLERQQARLLDVYLAEVIGQEEFERKRKEVTQTQHGLTQQLRQLDAQAQQQVKVAGLAQGIEAFCRRIHPTLDQLTFAQRRQVVELLIDRVIINDGQVEIRYVVPTGPKGETTPFCHLRLDYFNLKARLVSAIESQGLQVHIGAKEDRIAIALGMNHNHHLEVAFELHVIEHLMIQHDVVIFGVEAFKAGEITEVHLPIVGLLTTSTGALGTVIERAPIGIRSQFANWVHAEVHDARHEFLVAVSPIGEHVAQEPQVMRLDDPAELVQIDLHARGLRV
jgi:hypothetical protein